MKKRKLFRQFFGIHIVILFLSVGLVALYTWKESRRTFKSQWIKELQVQADLAVAMFEGADTKLNSRKECKRFFEKLSRLDRQRFTLIMPDGSVIGDTMAPVDEMDSHGMRPEVVEARSEVLGLSERYSSTLGTRMLYLARRVPSDLNLPEQAVLRVSVPMTTLSKKISDTRHEIFFPVAVVLVAALIMSYFASLRIIGPVSDLQTGLKRIGNGEYSFRLKIPGVPHLAELVRSINQTADCLEGHIHELEEERNLRALIFKSMDPGLIAVDTDRRIMSINNSAVRLLNVNAKKIDNCKLGEVVRYPELLEFYDISEKSEKITDATMRIDAGNDSDAERILTLQASALKDLQDQRIGTLIVLSDITRICRLETVRQDFVDNVSHELRTPVTSIKGFSETLLDGALQDPENARHFVSIIARQADQLDQIIRDLLELSRLDQSMDKDLECVETPVADMLRNSVELCSNRKEKTGAVIKVLCDESLVADVHPGLIEQALVNLIDNALKYGCSDTGGRIEISADCDDLAVRIKVRDFGNGVEKRHLERMFERFYRVDSGRSRELGGTGLGLAIVKHIVLIHNGFVDVESEPGKGTCFTLILPVRHPTDSV
ncbi:MAG: ATP-binding protein [Kiritimatiellia bacterium]